MYCLVNTLTAACLIRFNSQNCKSTIYGSAPILISRKSTSTQLWPLGLIGKATFMCRTILRSFLNFVPIDLQQTHWQHWNVIFCLSPQVQKFLKTTAFTFLYESTLWIPCCKWLAIRCTPPTLHSSQALHWAIFETQTWWERITGQIVFRMSQYVRFE